MNLKEKTVAALNYCNEALVAKDGEPATTIVGIHDKILALPTGGISLADVGIYIGDYTNSSTFTINYGVVDKYNRLLVS